MEEWRPINGYEGIYEISTKGRVRSSYSNRVLIGTTNGIGYKKVQLWKDGKYKCKYIHRLVAEHFIPNIENLKEVNHIDGCRSNNDVSNLEWVSSSGNTIHAIEITKHMIPWGNSPIPIIAIDLVSGERKFFKTISIAERELGTKHITDVLKGKRNMAKGHTFICAEGSDINENTTNRTS